MLTCMECGRQFKVLKHTHFKYGCTGVIKTTDEYRIKYPNAQITSAEVRKQMAHSEESFINRYGIDKGKAKWEEYTAKLSFKNSLEAFLAKGKTEDDWKMYNASRAVTLENLIKRHGLEAGQLKWQAYCEKQKTNGNTLEYFVAKLGEVEGATKYSEVCKLKGITLENMIRKHGYDEGFLRYHKFLESTKCNFVSLVSSQFIREIIEKLPANYIFHDGVFGKEFCIYNEKVMMYDFVVTSPVKKVVEFNGNFWHADPKVYKADDLVPIRGGAKKASEIWQSDLKKKLSIESRGFEVLVVWEKDYLENPKKVVEDVSKWIIS